MESITYQQNPAFAILGRSIRTTNEGGQSIRDQGELWASLIREGFLEVLPAADRFIYGLYNEYMGDHTKPFTFTIGAKPADTDAPPLPGLVRHLIGGGDYAVFTSRLGNPAEVVGETWEMIWRHFAGTTRPRAYRQDYEIYDRAEMANGRIQVRIHISLL